MTTMNLGAEMIQIDSISKNYGELWAVEDLALEIPRGEVFAFLGPNGAGKTTTIKMITGLIRPTKGRVLLAGHDVQKDPIEAIKRVGYIPDHPYLYEKLTGYELLDFVADLHHIPDERRRELINELFEMFGLQAWRNHLVQQYSHGMRQKLVFGAALIHDPEILVVDEPMVGLDPRSAKLIKEIFRERAHRGTTVFLSTHTLSVAEEVADRIGLIMKGRLTFVGNLEAMREAARSEGNLEELFLELTAEQEQEQEPDAAFWLNKLEESAK